VNSRTAQNILLAWRPGHGDLRDPEVAQALEHARRDPALREWIERHAAFQRTLEKSFRQIPVPDGLPDQILARARAAGRRRHWGGPAWLAAAAAVMLLLGWAALWFKPAPAESFATFRDRTVRGVQRVYPAMDIQTNDMAQVRKFLASRKAPADYTLPSGLSRLPVQGAGVVRWQGRAVSMVCLDSIDRGTLFLFVLDEAGLTAPPSAAAEFVPVFEMMTASWTQGGIVYLLAGRGGAEALHRHL
jgi:hypothetical protein